MLLTKLSSMDLYSYEGLSEAAQLVIDILQEYPQAKQRLEAVGFGNAQFQTGKKCIQAVDGYSTTRTQLEQERWSLSKQMNAGVKAVRDQLSVHRKAASFALRDKPEQLHSLNIDRLERGIWACVKQSIHFHQQVLQQKISLEAQGISQKEVQEALKTATQLLQDKKTRFHQKGLRQQNTRELRQAIVALRAWVMEFRANARLAYRQQPQMLEMFDIRVKASV